ncbi:MAG: class I SAM-dependent methyltransferase [Anaerolineae bacterium]
MTPQIIDRLNAINRQFYETTAQKFDQTRQRSWAGWQPLAAYLAAPLRVLDVGCGNGRFGLFLHDVLDGEIIYHGVDNNAQLLAYAREALAPHSRLQVTITEQDVIVDPLPTGNYDAVALFGVIHHVPGFDNRRHFVTQLAERVAQGGLLIMAMWRFYEYERFRQRFVPFPDDLPVEQHDYLLDWRSGERALRYCHYVDDAELEVLIRASGLQEVTRYRADGTDNAMNQYIILRR